jgi:hypothetical protein
MLDFLNIESEWEHYKRQLAQNSPVETRAYYRDDRIYAMHCNGDDGRFITGAVFADDRRGGVSVFLGLSGPL